MMIEAKNELEQELNANLKQLRVGNYMLLALEVEDMNGEPRKIRVRVKGELGAFCVISTTEQIP